MSILVVTGTSTGVGKTIVTAAIAALSHVREATVAVVKPVQTGVTKGEPGDLADIRRLTDVPSLHELARFDQPLSPAAAARLAGQPGFDMTHAARVVRDLADHHDLVIVEGAGGLLVRFDEDGSTIADLARMLAAPVVVVTEPGLGTLNHTALTLEALAHRGLQFGGLIVGSWPLDPDLAMRTNLRDLQMLAARPLDGAIQAGAASLTPAEFLEAARNGLAPALGGRFDARDFVHRWSPKPEGTTT